MIPQYQINYQVTLLQALLLLAVSPNLNLLCQLPLPKLLLEVSLFSESLVFFACTVYNPVGK